MHRSAGFVEESSPLRKFFIFNDNQGWLFCGCSRMERAEKAPYLKLEIHIPQGLSLTQLYLNYRRSKKIKMV